MNPAFLKSSYFKKVQDHFGTKYYLSDEIKEKVEFIREDITKGHQKNQKYDIIFCRYFLIYTDKNLRIKILQLLDEQLVEGGLLILGKTETLMKLNTNFKIIDGKNQIYIKSSNN